MPDCQIGRVARLKQEPISMHAVLHIDGVFINSASYIEPVKASTQSQYTELVQKASTQSKYTEQVHRASTQSQYTEPVHRASTQSKYTEQVHRASTQSKYTSTQSQYTEPVHRASTQSQYTKQVHKASTQRASTQSQFSAFVVCLVVCQMRVASGVCHDYLLCAGVLM